jgi:hypothetical protein
MAVSKRLRYEILRRDNHACRYCGSTAPDVALTVDHVIPTTLGGSDDPSNLVTACVDCNSGKSATPPGAPLVADVAADQARWALAMRATAETFLANADALSVARDEFDNTWVGWTYGTNQYEIPRPHDWGSTVDRFMAAGFTMPLLLDCVRIAMESRASPDDTWRYFCGVAWRRLTEMQDVARQVADSLATEDEGGHPEPNGWDA